jgi:hypothetical protein
VSTSAGGVVTLQLLGNDAEDLGNVTFRKAESASGNIELNNKTGLVTYSVGNSPSSTDNLE